MCNVIQRATHCWSLSCSIMQMSAAVTLGLSDWLITVFCSCRASVSMSFVTDSWWSLLASSCSGSWCTVFGRRASATCLSRVNILIMEVHAHGRGTIRPPVRDLVAGQLGGDAASIRTAADRGSFLGIKSWLWIYVSSITSRMIITQSISITCSIMVQSSAKIAICVGMPCDYVQLFLK